MVLPNQNWCWIDKKRVVSSAVSQIMKKDPVLLFAAVVSNNEKRHIFVVRKGYKALLTIALMPVKRYTVFRCFFSFLQKICSNNFTKLYSSLFTNKTSKESCRMHTPYADTDVLQNLCLDSVFRSGLTKGACNQDRKNFACSIVSLDIRL